MKSPRCQVVWIVTMDLYCGTMWNCSSTAGALTWPIINGGRNIFYRCEWCVATSWTMELVAFNGLSAGIRAYAYLRTAREVRMYTDCNKHLVWHIRVVRKLCYSEMSFAFTLIPETTLRHQYCTVSGVALLWPWMGHLNDVASLTHPFICWCAGTGRRNGLKHRRWNMRKSSSLFTSTNYHIKMLYIIVTAEKTVEILGKDLMICSSKICIFQCRNHRLVGPNELFLGVQSVNHLQI